MENSDEVALQLHIAEYNALTTRATYFINIQVVLLLGLISWLGIGATFFNPKSPKILWIILFVGQVIGLIASWLLYEEHNIAYYVETILRKKIIKIKPDCDFWQYEQYLTKHRKKVIIYLEYPGFIVSAAAVIYVAAYHSTWQTFDWLGLIGNSILVSILGYANYCSYRVQKRSWEATLGMTYPT